MKPYLRLIISVALGTNLLTTTAIADTHYNICDNKFETEKGEKPGGPFHAMGLAIMAYGLAKYKCDANVPDVVEHFQWYSEQNSCGADTEIYQILTKSTELVKEKLASSPNIDQGVQKLIEDLGGCEKLKASAEAKINQAN